MGGGASVLQEIRQDWLDIFKAMKLKNYEVKRLYKIYNSVDADRSGSIDVVELLTFLDIERTPFTERIFEAFDKDHTRRVDFYEFVVSAWKFCVLGNEAACKFCGFGVVLEYLTRGVAQVCLPLTCTTQMRTGS